MLSPAELRAAIEAELDEDLLPFWRERCVDLDNGGFIGEMDNEGVVRSDAAKGLILNSRILWSFSAVYRTLGEPRDLELSRRAYAYLREHFADREHGGFHWSVDSKGQPLDGAKRIYGQAFCIYSLSEYHRATGDSAALEAAQVTFELLERHAHDDSEGGYFESLSADWSPAADQRLSRKDMDAPKSMNNHLHVLEAYTHLYRVWPDSRVAARLGELIDLFDRHIVSRTAEGCHLHHFFDATWRVLSNSYTYGHDIEAAWLLTQAAAVLGDHKRRVLVQERAVELARAVFAEALDVAGALAYAGREGQVIDSNREWWCQAEGIVGFWQAYSTTGESAFGEAAGRIWHFIDTRMVDRVHGEWFWRVFPDGSVDPSEPKVSEWKGPYHNVRMCLEMLQRIDGNVER